MRSMLPPVRSTALKGVDLRINNHADCFFVDVPEAKDLETPLEVGSFAWNWMEPPLGYISFFLLCMQYSRAQMENLGVKPYTYWFKHRRAERLCSEFPKYNSTVVYSFSEGDSLSGGDVHATK